MNIPAIVEEICNAVASADGQAWLVGGVVRDHLMGIVSKDFDIEVHRVEADDLHDLLCTIGPVNEVGRSFGVFKLTRDGIECDVSIPRHDSQSGERHKDIVVLGNPYMGIESAARRRDLTINSIAYDPLTRTYADPFGGTRDIERGRLQAVDPATFSEDPLRALRVVQFAARFGFSVQPDLAKLCKEASLFALPSERIWGELEKLLLRAPAPSIGWSLMHQLQITPKILPDLTSVPTEALNVAIDRAAERRSSIDGTGRKIILMLSVLLHRSSPLSVEATLDQLNIHRLHGVQVRKRVQECTALWSQLTQSVSDQVLRRLADQTELTLLAETAAAASGKSEPLANLDRAAHLGIAMEPLPTLIKGRDLSTAGVDAGPEMGEILRRVRDAQIEGEVSDRAGALVWLKDYLK